LTATIEPQKPAPIMATSTAEASGESIVTGGPNSL
jgi:hypothetical protein